MKIGLCYPSVLPARGGAETYIADLARQLAADGHEVHLFASQWDANALPAELIYHRLTVPSAPRFLRPWLFAAACRQALDHHPELISIGFDKTWGQDVMHPLGGLHTASADHNIGKFASRTERFMARCLKAFDLAHWSYTLLERKQYLGDQPPLIAVNSYLVRQHFEHYLGVSPEDVRVVRSAVDGGRFAQPDRLRRRVECREEWGIQPNDSAGLFVAMNYRLKGLEPLLHAVALMSRGTGFRLLVVGNPNVQRYQRLAQRLGIDDRVIFLGPRRDVQHCFFAADFLVHPTFYDPCSLVVLEALVCGLPVITTRYNGASELLHPPRDGFVLDDPHDHAALATAMTCLLDPATRSACAQEARRSAGHWDFDQHYHQLLAVFEEAARRKQAA